MKTLDFTSVVCKGRPAEICGRSTLHFCGQIIRWQAIDRVNCQVNNMRLRKVKDRGQSTKLKRLQWSLVKVKDRSGHNFESCVSPWCLWQSNYSIVQTCDKFSLSSLRSGALIEPTLTEYLRKSSLSFVYLVCKRFFFSFHCLSSLCGRKDVSKTREVYFL